MNIPVETKEINLRTFLANLSAPNLWRLARSQRRVESRPLQDLLRTFSNVAIEYGANRTVGHGLIDPYLQIDSDLTKPNPKNSINDNLLTNPFLI
jgi:hypothetical protein